MKLVITGGGTGGHVIPALVVGEHLAQRGASLKYLGSLRGQEGNSCRQRGVSFLGFPSEPLYSLKSPAGWRSLVALLLARSMVIAHFRKERPDAVFSTGGYSAGPVVSAARKLGIPYVLHASDSVPGRAHLAYAKEASAITCVFEYTIQHLSHLTVTRTGQPIRPELRAAASHQSGKRQVFVLGGSQGSEFLNDLVPQAALLAQDVHFVHATGPKNIESMQARLREMGIGDNYDARGYLDTDEMVDAYKTSSVVIARSGGTVAEIAMFGLPSVLVPLPTSADDHQLHNAEEFVNLKAATLFKQDKQSSPQKLAESLFYWLESRGAAEQAARNLAEWDVPDATDRIANIIEKVAN